MLRVIDGTEFWMAVISSKRSHAVENMNKWYGPATWYVPEDEVNDYNCVTVPIQQGENGLVAARNQALEDAFSKGIPCVLSEDDITNHPSGRFFVLTGRGDRTERTLRPKGYNEKFESIDDVVELINRRHTECYYGAFPLHGVAAHSDTTAFKEPMRISRFIIGTLMVIYPTHLRFDPAFHQMEDYDFTAANLKEYGGAVKHCDIILEYGHWDNAGGTTGGKTEAEGKIVEDLLEKKYPGLYRRSRQRNKDRTWTFNSDLSMMVPQDNIGIYEREFTLWGVKEPIELVHRMLCEMRIPGTYETEMEILERVVVGAYLLSGRQLEDLPPLTTDLRIGQKGV